MVKCTDEHSQVYRSKVRFLCDGDISVSGNFNGFDTFITINLSVACNSSFKLGKAGACSTVHTGIETMMTAFPVRPEVYFS